jgi:predicted metal-dependent hydrolase
MKNGPEHPFKIIRSKRKTYEIRILPDGSIEVRVPARATKAQVEQILAEKAAWITSKQALVEQRRLQAAARRSEEFEKFLYLGKEYALLLVEEGTQSSVLVFKEGFRLKESAKDLAAVVLEKWYRLQARRIFNERVKILAQQYGITYGPVKVSSAQTRWGSCGAKGSLNFTWRLVMAPLEVIDYVVVHELAHIKEHNHSSRFWSEVERLMPDYRWRRDWLKANGHRLKL